VVVETIDEKEVDPAVAPIHRGGKRTRDFDILAVYEERAAG
jgi:hypothetical protein